jgi:hypothetical protein
MLVYHKAALPKGIVIDQHLHREAVDVVGLDKQVISIHQIRPPETASPATIALGQVVRSMLSAVHGSRWQNKPVYLNVRRKVDAHHMLHLNLQRSLKLLRGGGLLVAKWWDCYYHNDHEVAF